jgi:hypothetical protein
LRHSGATLARGLALLALPLIFCALVPMLRVRIR